MRFIALAFALLCAAAAPAAAQSFNSIDGWADSEFASGSPNGAGVGSAPAQSAARPPAPATGGAYGAGAFDGSGHALPYTPPKTECPAYMLCW